MKKDLKWMLLGIFLAVASCWCLLFVGDGGSPLVILCYALPIAAVITFGTGFSGVDGPKSGEKPEGQEDEESQGKAE